MGEFNPESVALRIRAIDSEDDAEALVSELKVDEPHSRAVFDELASSVDVDVRSFVADRAADVLGRAAVTLLLRMIEDSDADVSSIAISELIEISPSEAGAAAPKLRRRLSVAPDFERVFLMWRLAKLGDRNAIALLRDIAATEAGTEPGDVAGVAALLIAGRAAEARRRLLGHEHRKTKSLAMGLTVHGDSADRAALTEGALKLPDDACRGWCRSALAVIARDDAMRGD